MYFENCGPVLSVFNVNNDYPRILKLVENTLGRYDIYKAKELPANKVQQSELDSFEASFQLLLIMSNALTNLIRFENIDFQRLRGLMRLAVTKNDKNVDFLRIFFHNFVYICMDNNYMVTARLFFTMQIHCSEQLLRFMEECGDLSAEKKMISTRELLHTELSYLERFFNNSFLMMLHDTSWSEEQQAREDVLDGFLDEVEVKDRYAIVPKMIQTFRQAERFSELMLSKISEYKTLVKDTKSADAAKVSIPLWKGCVYNLLSFYQKEHAKSVKLAKKSIGIWDALLREYFSEDDLQKYIDDKYEEVLKYYAKLIKASSSNYIKVITVKCNSHMGLNPTDPAAKIAIKEVNVLRRELIAIYNRCISFQTKRPKEFEDELMKEMHYKIAEQYRSIIVDKKNMKEQVKNSRVHLNKYIYYARKCKSEHEVVTDKEIFQYFEHQVDYADPFIQKFRTEMF